MSDRAKELAEAMVSGPLVHVRPRIISLLERWKKEDSAPKNIDEFRRDLGRRINDFMEKK